MLWVVLFATSWATIQISHLSMTGDLTCQDEERVFLTSVRNAATVLSSIIINLAAMLLLSFDQEESNETAAMRAAVAADPELSGGLSWSDRKSFTYLGVSGQCTTWRIDKCGILCTNTIECIDSVQYNQQNQQYEFIRRTS